MKKEYIKPIIINIKICNDDALCQMQRASLLKSTKAILLKILPSKMTDRSPMVESFGMTNNFISRFSKKNFNNERFR